MDKKPITIDEMIKFLQDVKQDTGGETPITFQVDGGLPVAFPSRAGKDFITFAVTNPIEWIPDHNGNLRFKLYTKPNIIN